MNKMEEWLYEGVPDEERPERNRGDYKKPEPKGEKLTLEELEQQKDFTEGEKYSPLQTAQAYARAIARDNATEKGHRDNVDYIKAIVLIFLSAVAVYAVFGILIGVVGSALSVPPAP